MRCCSRIALLNLEARTPGTPGLRLPDLLASKSQMATGGHGWSVDNETLLPGMSAAIRVPPRDAAMAQSRAALSHCGITQSCHGNAASHHSVAQSHCRGALSRCGSALSHRGNAQPNYKSAQSHRGVGASQPGVALSHRDSATTAPFLNTPQKAKNTTSVPHLFHKQRVSLNP
jgi:hypothetical protein